MINDCALLCIKFLTQIWLILIFQLIQVEAELNEQPNLGMREEMEDA